MYHIGQELIVVNSGHHNGETCVVLDVYDDDSYLVEWLDGVQGAMLSENLVISLPSWDSIYCFTNWYPGTTKH